jgi:hypothetical protein
MKLVAAIIVSWLLLSGLGALFGREIDLALWQRHEAARRKAAPPPRLSIDDANIHTLSVPGRKYHFTQLSVDPPLGLDDDSRMQFAAPSDRAHLIKMERELEERIFEAQANIERYEKKIRTVELDVAPYRIWDKPGYVEERKAELRRWIEGEGRYIYFTKKRLAGLR